MGGKSKGRGRGRGTVGNTNTGNNSLMPNTRGPGRANQTEEPVPTSDRQFARNTERETLSGPAHEPVAVSTNKPSNIPATVTKPATNFPPPKEVASSQSDIDNEGWQMQPKSKSTGKNVRSALQSTSSNPNEGASSSQSAWGKTSEPINWSNTIGGGNADNWTNVSHHTRPNYQNQQAQSSRQSFEYQQGGQGRQSYQNPRGYQQGRQNYPNQKGYQPNRNVSNYNQPESSQTRKEVTLCANYFRLLKVPNWSVFQYNVTFAGGIETIGAHRKLIFDNKLQFGGYIFDGSTLYTTTEIKDKNITTKDSVGNTVQIVIKKTKILAADDSSYIQVLNLILRRALRGLKLQLIGRNYYDAREKKTVPYMEDLEYWPGYVTSIRSHKNDILICTETNFKFIRLQTIKDLMRKYQNKDQIKAELLGKVAMTIYNNKTYKITDVDFDQTPKSTFEKNGVTISYVEYYKQKYNFDIKDFKQPLLVSRPTARNERAGQVENIVLIPELCRCTGIPEAIRSDMRMMRNISSATRLDAAMRIEKLRAFSNRLYNEEDSYNSLKGWNLELDRELVTFKGHRLPINTIHFNNNSQSAGENADWTFGLRDSQLIAKSTCKRLVILTPQQFDNIVKDFYRMLSDIAKKLGFTIEQQIIHFVPGREVKKKEIDYVIGLEEAFHSEPNMILIIVPDLGNARYATIKKKVCIDRPVLSQVLSVGSMKDEKKGRSIATKLAIQMNCKLGGVPWTVALPDGLITIGLDVCHDTSDKSKSFAAIVATMNFSRSEKPGFHSAVRHHTNGEEISNFLPIETAKAIRRYKDIYNALPKKIIIYRDGVGEGQIKHVNEFELNPLNKLLKEIYDPVNLSVNIAFIIVTKRLNTRIFENAKNPLPGTVVDKVITLPNRDDFYLISQSVKQGTVSPTNYNIIYNSTTLDSAQLQNITYKMTHLYYNWSGTTRVPAVVQYAHKLAFLVGQYLHGIPDPILDKFLYFL